MTATGTIPRHFPARHDAKVMLEARAEEDKVAIVLTVSGEPPTTMTVSFTPDEAERIAVDVRKVIFQIRRLARASQTKSR